jgi:hypothetical protein
MSMSNTSETKLLQLLFHNDAWELIGDASGLQPSATAGSFYVALHTTDPADAGDQTTNEISYTGYARVAVARTSAKWSVSGATVSNIDAVQFGECTAGTASVDYFSVGTAASGAGSILYSGQLSATRAISSGITPLFNAGALQGTVD